MTAFMLSCSKAQEILDILKEHYPSHGDTTAPKIDSSIKYAGKINVGIGDSWMTAAGATAPVYGWFPIICQELGATMQNLGVSGMSIEPHPCRPLFYKENIPLYDSTRHAALHFALSLNDVGLNISTFTPQEFERRLLEIIEYAITVRKWPRGIIFLYTPGWVLSFNTWVKSTSCLNVVKIAATYARLDSFSVAVYNVAQSKRTQLIDMRRIMENSFNSTHYISDSAHLNNSGNRLLADSVILKIKYARQ